MNLQSLKKLVIQIKKNVHCPFCDHEFHIKNIHLIAAAHNEATFHINCHYCCRPVVVSASFKKSSNDIKNSIIDVQSPEDAISANEVLDMHNFLKHCKGDITKFLKIKRQ